MKDNSFDIEATILELFLKEQHIQLAAKYGLKEDEENKKISGEYTDIPGFAIDALWRFKKSGFPVTFQTVERFIKLSELVSIYDISDIYLLFKMLLCKTTEDEKKFRSMFYKQYSGLIKKKRIVLPNPGKI